eukprot:622373_1
MGGLKCKINMVTITSTCIQKQPLVSDQFEPAYFNKVHVLHHHHPCKLILYLPWHPCLLSCLPPTNKQRNNNKCIINNYTNSSNKTNSNGSNITCNKRMLRNGNSNKTNNKHRFNRNGNSACNNHIRHQNQIQTKCNSSITHPNPICVRKILNRIQTKIRSHMRAEDSESDSNSSSSISSCSDSESTSSEAGTEYQDNEHEVFKNHPPPVQNLHISHPQQPQHVPRDVPPVKQIQSNQPIQQYRFQPIVPPKMNNVMSSESNKQEMPSPAFNPNKLPSPELNPPEMQGNLSGMEGTELPLPVSEDELPISPMMVNHQKSVIFNAMLQQPDKKKHLDREENWEMLFDGIQSNCPIADQYDIFKAMRKVAKNLLLDDEKYMVLYADNDMVQKKILGRVGGYEFLRGVGFKKGSEENELVVAKLDKDIVNNAIRVLQKRIDALKKRRHEWDPKYHKKKKDKVPHIPVQPQADVIDEEQRMLEEAIRLSKQEHVQEVLNRQQKALDRVKSGNLFSANQEDDYKAAYM